MKVNTDSLILGSWAQPEGHRAILDIGTGTGILALMLLQRADPEAIVDALDIDEGAVNQARDNARRSPWGGRIQVEKADITAWQPPRQYSLIISNPPYFDSPSTPSNAYRQQSAERKFARSAAGFTPASLFRFVQAYLTEKGTFYCLYPNDLVPEIASDAAAQGLFIHRQLDVRHRPETACYVSALQMGKSAASLQKSMLNIRDSQGEYSQAYRALCRPYYLRF